VATRRDIPENLRIKREPQRGVYDRATIEAILDEALVCHLGFEIDGQPYVIPTLHARIGDRLYVHGASELRVCVTVTLLDGLVLARSVFNHSINYRSVVVLGSATNVEGDEKTVALRAFTEHVAPGRWDEARQPTEQELKATWILSLPLTEASAKVRRGPPEDDAEDLDFPVWSGVVPIHLAAEPSEYRWGRVRDGRVVAP
jgi:nitroimidazol reductase NimA-like FMN-containing flavoprotein (pyridoxamine 5'-phosphate oxidase superfamily)